MSTNCPQGEVGRGSSTGEERGETGAEADVAGGLQVLCPASSTSEILDFRRVIGSLCVILIEDSWIVFSLASSVDEAGHSGKLSSNDTIRGESDNNIDDGMVGTAWQLLGLLQRFVTLGISLGLLEVSIGMCAYFWVNGEVPQADLCLVYERENLGKTKAKDHRSIDHTLCMLSQGLVVPEECFTVL